MVLVRGKRGRTWENTLDEPIIVIERRGQTQDPGAGGHSVAMIIIVIIICSQRSSITRNDIVL